MSPLESEFRESCKECVEAGTRLGLPPADIIGKLNALVSSFGGKAAQAGHDGNFALVTHAQFVKVISEIVPLVATYEGLLSETEHSVLTYFRDKSARCLPKRAVALGIPEQFQSEFPKALVSLYRRGLIKDGEQNISICLTEAGKGFIDGSTTHLIVPA